MTTQANLNRKLSEAALIMKMQEPVIAHLQSGHEMTEVISVIQSYGAEWRMRAEKLLAKIEQDEAYYHHERTGVDPTEQELLLEALVVIENNSEAIAKEIEG